MNSQPAQSRRNMPTPNAGAPSASVASVLCRAWNPKATAQPAGGASQRTRLDRLSRETAKPMPMNAV